MEKLLKLRDEMKEDLLHGSIFPFWEQYTIDHENGGFYGAVTVDKVIHKDASKGLVLNARLLWTFAGAYRIFGDEKYKELADRAFNYIVERFWDHKNGGGFWMLHADGSVEDDTKIKAGGDSYSYTWFEQAWIPAGAEHLDAAKQFVAYLYSDEACKLFAESGAIQPVLGIADSLEGDNKMFYSIYDNGAKAAMGNFASFTAIPGVEVRTVFFDPVNSLVSGSMTEQQWIDGIKSASDQMRANIIE